MADQTITIAVTAQDLAAANSWAGDLEDSLLDDVPDASIQRIRSDELAQDFGTSLVVVLSAPAVIRLASGVEKWLARRSEAKLDLRRTDGDGRQREVHVEGRLSSGRIEQLLREFFS